MGSTESLPAKRTREQLDADDDNLHSRIYECLDKPRSLIWGSHALKMFRGEEWKSNDMDVAVALHKSESHKEVERDEATKTGERSIGWSPSKVLDQEVSRFSKCMGLPASHIGNQVIERPNPFNSHPSRVVSYQIMSYKEGVPTSGQQPTVNNFRLHFVGYPHDNVQEMRETITRSACPPANITCELTGRRLPRSDFTYPWERMFTVPTTARNAVLDGRILGSDVDSLKVIRQTHIDKYRQRGYVFGHGIKGMTPDDEIAATHPRFFELPPGY